MIPDYQIHQSDLLADCVYRTASLRDLADSGAWGVNAQWEQGTTEKWYIEQQRYGANLVIAGALHDDTSLIDLGFRAFDWGFNRQSASGAFLDTADPFHSTASFIQAVAHACLLLRQTRFASSYEPSIRSYASRCQRAARWMILPEVWSRGTANNRPYTHRRYLVAAALMLSGRAVGGDGRLATPAKAQIAEALSLQWPNGVNPELGGYDASYQGVGLCYAAVWCNTFDRDSLVGELRTAIDRGLGWLEGRILATGEIDVTGSTRVGRETGPSGTTKLVDWRKAVLALAYWAAVTGNEQWELAARRVGAFCG